jgi:hypothetical protein
MKTGFVVCHAVTHGKVAYFVVCPAWDTRQILETLLCALLEAHGKVKNSEENIIKGKEKITPSPSS